MGLMLRKALTQVQKLAKEEGCFFLGCIAKPDSRPGCEGSLEEDHTVVVTAGSPTDGAVLLGLICRLAEESRLGLELDRCREGAWIG